MTTSNEEYLQRNSWIEKNGMDLLSIAREKKQSILTEYQPEPLDATTETNINTIVREHVH